MIVLELTEYRGDGNFYPITLVLFENVAVFEAQLMPPGPPIVGQHSLGVGSYIVGAVPGMKLVVRETVAEVTKRLKSNEARVSVAPISGTGL